MAWGGKNEMTSSLRICEVSDVIIWHQVFYRRKNLNPQEIDASIGKKAVEKVKRWRNGVRLNTHLKGKVELEHTGAKLHVQSTDYVRIVLLSVRFPFHQSSLRTGAEEMYKSD